MALSINGEVVPDSVLAQEADNIRSQLGDTLRRADSPEQRRAVEAQIAEWARENIVRRVLLNQTAVADEEPLDAEAVTQAKAALKQQYGGEEQFAKCMNVTPANTESMQHDMEMQLKVDRIVRRVTARVAKPGRNEVADQYRKNKDPYRRPEMVRVRHIVKHVAADTDRDAAREVLERALQETRAGADFAEIADRDSDCTGNGGDLGYFPRGQMVEAFDRVVFELTAGQVSDVFETEFGYHIARLEDRAEERLLSLKEAAPQIEDEIMNRKRRNVLDNYIAGLRKNALIEDTT